jgi:hypothetical protein
MLGWENTKYEKSSTWQRETRVSQIYIYMRVSIYAQKLIREREREKYT